MKRKLKQSGSSANGGGFILIYLCFITFGLLSSMGRPDTDILNLAFPVVISLAVGILAVKLLTAVLNSGNESLRKDNPDFAKETVRHGMMFIIPFTALALLAKVGLGWNAVMPFASSAIMTAATTAGTEAMKKGAKGKKYILIPSFLAFVLSTIWMMSINIQL